MVVLVENEKILEDTVKNIGLTINEMDLLLVFKFFMGEVVFLVSVAVVTKVAVVILV